MTRVRPSMPFPPIGPEADGFIDLGVRLRDTLFRRQHVEKPVRAAIVERLNAAVDAEEGVRAAELVQALVDTWPVAHMVDAAREAWTTGPDGPALAVLFRAAQLTAFATGARPGWPRPGPVWASRITGSRLVTGVQRRHPDDDADTLAAIFKVEVEPGPPVDVPAVPRVNASELAVLRHELGRGLALGEIVAVEIVGAIPADPEAQLAAWEIRLEAQAQRSVDRYGIMGALVPDAPAWPTLLGPAPPGQPSEAPRAVATVLRLPGTISGLKAGTIEPTPWLVWGAPVRPVPVTGGAAAVLSRLDGARTAADIATEIGAPVEAVADVMRGLVSAGAASAAPPPE